MGAGSYFVSKHIGRKRAKTVNLNSFAASLPVLLPANVCFTSYHLALPSNQAVSYSMLQLGIMWLTLFSVYFILELSIVLVLGLLYICGTGFEIYFTVGTSQALLYVHSK